MSLSPRVDIIITNYNYAHYVAHAVESARRQRDVTVHVIVVDDGSTDESRERLRAYEHEVELVLKRNGGQASAINAGLSRSSADVVLLLDGDDVLLPHTAANVASVFASQPEVVKVQFPLRVIDAEGRATGGVKPPPHLPRPNGDVRKAELAFPFDLPWLPTSGNAFRADALRRILPIPEDEYPVCADAYLVHLTALLGAVASLTDVGALYRVHGRNNHERQSHHLDLAHLREGMTYSQATTSALTRLADELELDRPRRILAISYLAQRLISCKLDPEAHPVGDDHLHSIVGDAIRAAHRRFDISLAMKLGFVGWFMATAAAPRPIARRLAQLFLYPDQRMRPSRFRGQHRSTFVA